jgi:protein-disulfide isomerase
VSESLGSAPLEPVGPGAHVRGPEGAPEVVLYLDLACPHCAADWARIRALPLRLCVRHFPVASKRPRSPALHAAVEAAAEIGGEAAFWSMWDSLLADQAHQDDPHLWQRARELELDLDRFETLRRAEATAERVRADFRGGIRVGVTGTPTAFAAGQPVGADVAGRLAELAAGFPGSPEAGPA